MGTLKELRAATVYLSPERAIVAALHYNAAGLRFEQMGATVVQPWVGNPEMSTALRSALASFSLNDVNQRDAKLTDWSAFIASGLRSASQFERQFQRVYVSAVNEAELFYTAEVEAPNESNLALKTTLNRYAESDSFAAPLERLFSICHSWDRMLD